MARGDHLGEFEALVLLALVRLGNEGYGMTVRREIEATSGRDVAIGSVYATLERLETKGHLKSWHTDPEPRRGGKARRHFRITPAGVQTLADARRISNRMWNGVVLPAEGDLS